MQNAKGKMQRAKFEWGNMGMGNMGIWDWGDMGMREY